QGLREHGPARTEIGVRMSGQRNAAGTARTRAARGDRRGRGQPALLPYHRIGSPAGEAVRRVPGGRLRRAVGDLMNAREPGVTGDSPAGSRAPFPIENIEIFCAARTSTKPQTELPWKVRAAHDKFALAANGCRGGVSPGRKAGSGLKPMQGAL